jgi:hypothetical protein
MIRNGTKFSLYASVNPPEVTYGSYWVDLKANGYGGIIKHWDGKLWRAVSRGDTGAVGPQGPQGAIGRSATVTVGSTTAATNGVASVTNSGTANDAILNFKLPTGPKGDSGTMTVGSVFLVPYGDSPFVRNVGSATAARLEFGLPQGPQGIQGIQGLAGTLSIRNVWGLNPGELPRVENLGTVNNAILDIYIPRLEGKVGPQGPAVPLMHSIEYGGMNYAPSNESVKQAFSAVNKRLEGLEGFGDLLGTINTRDLLPATVIDAIALWGVSHVGENDYAIVTHDDPSISPDTNPGATQPPVGEVEDFVSTRFVAIVDGNNITWRYAGRYSLVVPAMAKVYYSPLEQPVPTSFERYTGDVYLHKISKTGLYEDIIGAPKIFTNDVTVKYTYVVRSNIDLIAWAENKPDNDYSSVLISKGIFSYSGKVNLTVAGTKVVVGEPGSQLILDNYGLAYDAEMPMLEGYYMRDVIASCFTNCVNLTNCFATGANATHPDIDIPGFYRCLKLNNCSAIDGNTGFKYCKYLNACHVSSNSVAGYMDCVHMVFNHSNTAALNKYIRCFVDEPKTVIADYSSVGGFND